MEKFSLNVGSGHKPKHMINKFKCINVDIRSLQDDDLYKEGEYIFLQCDVTNLPFSNNFFEAILASDIVEHFPISDTEGLISEWARVLKPAGKILFRTPSLKWMAETYLHGGDAKFVSYHIFGGQTYDENFHYVIFDKPWLESICNKYGLVTVSYKEVHSNFELVMRKE